ncbi:MAG: hypothetical protein OEZ59_04435 [Deltaproteobacteria bacterium]|nr:hypothetical protein [Deltaproteobacteria bacterium]
MIAACFPGKTTLPATLWAAISAALPARTALLRALPVILLAGLLALLFSGAPARAQDRDYPTLVALGLIKPLQTSQGMDSGVVYLDHESRGYLGEGILNVTLDTVVLKAGLRHVFSPALGLGYRLRYTGYVEGYGDDIYLDGTRLKEVSFYGNSLAGVLALNLFPEGLWRATLELERLKAAIRHTPETLPGAPTPSDFHQNSTRLILSREKLPGGKKARLAATLARGERQGLENWALDPDAEEHAVFNRAELIWNQPVEWLAQHRSTLKLSALGGSNLDLFSGFNVGGFAGNYSVAGYYRNEYRARQGVVLNLEQEFLFAEDRVLSILLDGARLRTLDLPYLRTSDPQDEQVALTGAGLGLYWGIRSLAGLPLIIRYGRALKIPAGSPESHRHEILVVLAAGF